MQRVVERLVQTWRGAGMDRFFGDDVILVPAPRSSPLVPGALWPAAVIAQEMRRQGLARSVEPLLRRVTAVPKSSTARPGERLSVQRHLETLAAEPTLTGASITVMDDVITRGRMLYAAASRVQEAAPDAIVRTFAMVRTMSYMSDVERIVDPAVGELTSDGWGDVDRIP